MKTKYRIVDTRHPYFQVQFRRPWWPFWLNVNEYGHLGVGYHFSIEQAQQHAEKHAAKALPGQQKYGRTVQYLGPLPKER